MLRESRLNYWKHHFLFIETKQVLRWEKWKEKEKLDLLSFWQQLEASSCG